MNRPIKFRAWVKFESGNYGMLDHENLLDWSLREVLDDEGTDVLMQFTGLLDKNDKEIYDGDYLKCTLKEGYMRLDAGKEFIAQVHWFDYGIESGWWVKGTGDFDYSLDILVGYDIEVIGNIYENPELLK